jgi:hypothetical protein
MNNKKKDPYIAKALPTENNLMTEEGPIYSSFNFYGPGFNT